MREVQRLVPQKVGREYRERCLLIQKVKVELMTTFAIRAEDNGEDSMTAVGRAGTAKSDFENAAVFSGQGFDLSK
jgi:hypothetical protein